ncbi:ATP synthase j chain-domain-containing protein [Melampsora americana]|nr:ATP synthase j chain-domain-containing protein [Melampsora americana]
MSFFGLRAWPTPVWKPMSHFIFGGAVTFYLINKVQNSMLASPTYAQDPRNPHGMSSISSFDLI